MIIKVSPDLKKQEIFANGNQLANIMGMDRKNGKRILTYPDSEKVYVHTFKNPVLITDNYQISKLKPTLRDTLFSLYASPRKIFEYDGVSTIYKPSYISVWSPSIDTVLFAKMLNEIFKKRKDLQKALEIGCGSGFLSK